MKSKLFIAAAMLLTAVSCSMAFSTAELDGRIGKLQASPYVTVGSAGSSTQNRDIPFLVITDPESDSAQKMRVMVMVGQHGNEMAAVKGVLLMADHLANSDEDDIRNLRQQILFVIVPLVNPDGAVLGTRENGAGADLNRDWITQSQPEVHAVIALEKAWKPEIVIDAHQWLDGDQGISDFIETGNPVAWSIMESARPDLKLGSPKLVRNSPGANPHLAHRYFSSKGIPAYIVESRQGNDGGSRLWLYQHIIFNLVHSALDIRGNDSFRPGLWSVPPIVSRQGLSSIRAKNNPRPASGAAGIIMLGCYILLVVVLRNSGSTMVENKRPVRRIGVLPRHEHDIVYWMNRLRFDTRSKSRKNSVLF